MLRLARLLQLLSLLLDRLHQLGVMLLMSLLLQLHSSPLLVLNPSSLHDQIKVCLRVGHGHAMLRLRLRLCLCLNLCLHRLQLHLLETVHGERRYEPASHLSLDGRQSSIGRWRLHRHTRSCLGGDGSCRGRGSRDANLAWDVEPSRCCCGGGGSRERIGGSWKLRSLSGLRRLRCAVGSRHLPSLGCLRAGL